MTVTITVFRDQYAAAKSVQTHTLEELAELIKTTQRTSKQELPWLKLASFGNTPSNHNSLRHDANVLEATGCEADYDSEQMSFDAAVELLTKANVESIVYTSPSHEPMTPRWRVLAPFSHPLPPAEREHMLNRLNGVLGGVVADESFALSQAYYFGHLYEAIEVRAEAIRGTRIDLLDELDLIAIGKSGKQKSGNGEDTGTPFAAGELDVVEMIRRIESGESLHPPMLRLAGKLARELKSRPLITELLRGVFLTANQGRYAGRWPEVLHELNYALDKEALKKPETPAPTEILFPADIGAYDTQPIPEPEWIIQDLLPKGEVCLFSGAGAAGKSTIALDLCAAIVLGRDWNGTLPEQGPAMFIDAEDRLGIIVNRLNASRCHYNSTFAELADAGLHVYSLHSEETVLATGSPRGGIIEFTPLYNELRTKAARIKPKLIVLSSSANFYAASESDRSQVRQFISSLTRIASPTDAAVILISHPSLTGINSGTGISGSTAWHNSVRARWVIKDIKGDETDETEDISNLRTLEFQKNQYGPPQQKWTLAYRDGRFAREGLTAVSDYQRAAEEADAENTFMNLLRDFMEQGRAGYLSHKPNSPRNYAPRIFAQQPAGKNLGAKKLETAMDRLFAKGKIKGVQHGPASKIREHIVPAEEKS